MKNDWITENSNTSPLVLIALAPPLTIGGWQMGCAQGRSAADCPREESIKH
jgi:hypothetical protein